MARPKTTIPNAVKLLAVCERVFGISTRRYRQLADDGVVPRPVDGFIDFVRAVIGLIKYYRTLAESNGDEEFNNARTRKERAVANIKEHEFDTLKGKYTETAMVINHLRLLFTNFKNSLLAWLKSLPPLLANKSEKEIQQILKKEIYHLLGDLSKGVTSIMKKGSDENI